MTLENRHRPFKGHPNETLIEAAAVEFERMPDKLLLSIRNAHERAIYGTPNHALHLAAAFVLDYRNGERALLADDIPKLTGK
jgi:hypothetical protein